MTDGGSLSHKVLRRKFFYGAKFFILPAWPMFRCESPARGGSSATPCGTPRTSRQHNQESSRGLSSRRKSRSFFQNETRPQGPNGLWLFIGAIPDSTEKPSSSRNPPPAGFLPRTFRTMFAERLARKSSSGTTQTATIPRPRFGPKLQDGFRILSRAPPFLLRVFPVS